MGELSEMKSEKPSNPEAAEDTDHESDSGLETALDAFIKHPKRHKRGASTEYDKGYKKPENILTIISIILTASAVIFSGVAAIYAIGAYNAAESQAKSEGVAATEAQRQSIIAQEALVDENRPWIKVTITPSDVTWFPWGTAGMSPGLLLKNVGHSPALGVRAGAWAYVAGTKQDMLQFQIEKCASLKKTPIPQSQYGVTLFPGDDTDASHVGLGLLGFEIDPSQAPLRNKDGYGFYIIGCADYMFGSPPQHYQTFVAYEVWRVQSRTGLTKGLTGEFPQGASVPVSDIIIDPTYAGNYAN